LAFVGLERRHQGRSPIGQGDRLIDGGRVRQRNARDNAAVVLVGDRQIGVGCAGLIAEIKRVTLTSALGVPLFQVNRSFRSKGEAKCVTPDLSFFYFVPLFPYNDADWAYGKH
jgi:hypothetical protein